MALGEEKAEVEAPADTKTLSYGQWTCREQEVDTPGLASGEQEQPPCLEAERGPVSPVWGTEGLCAPGPSPSGAYQPQASTTSREPVAGRSKLALGCLLPPAGTGTRDLLHSVGSQVGNKANGTVDLTHVILWEYVLPFSYYLTCFLSSCTRWGIGGSLGVMISVLQAHLECWALGPLGTLSTASPGPRV